ncbi:MAG: ATP-binding cassette domain-containing protein, partial [Planctomycetota bacterium JB042]
MIRVERYSKTYDGFQAVRDLSFEVGAGEILGLVGPNGAGKTTTLRALAGILPPTSGRLEIGGFDVVDDAVEAKRRLAYVPDTPHPFDLLTVEEHLRFTALAYRIEDAEERFAGLLDE